MTSNNPTSYNFISIQAENEVNKLKSMSHPFIIRLLDYLPTEHKCYLVLEFARQGELFDEIALKGKKDENIAKFLFYQMVDAVDYMHKNEIAHRDLKPENILLCPQADSKKRDYPVIKIADMGLARECDQTSMETFCGTLMVIKFYCFRLEFYSNLFHQIRYSTVFAWNFNQIYFTKLDI